MCTAWVAGVIVRESVMSHHADVSFNEIEACADGVLLTAPVGSVGTAELVKPLHTYLVRPSAGALGGGGCGPCSSRHQLVR